MIDFAKKTEEMRNKKMEGSRMYKVYTDGSGIFEKDPTTGYNTKQVACERTYAIFKDNVLISKHQERVGGGVNPSNITGECSAVMHGLSELVNIMIKNKETGNVQILHDYVGLRHWVEGTWKAKENGPKLYVEAMKKIIQHANEHGIGVEFVKVASKDNKAHIMFYGGKTK